MGTYKKINGQAVPVTTEGHPQYYFQTKAQAEAALPTLEVGADVFVEEGGNEDVLPRVQELEEDVSEINSNLSADKSLSSDSTALLQNTVFTVPSDGYIVIQTLSGKVTKLYCVDNSNTNIEFSDFNNTSNDALNSSVFVKKGMKLVFTSSSTSGSAVFKPLV